MHIDYEPQIGERTAEQRIINSATKKAAKYSGVSK